MASESFKSHEMLANSNTIFDSKYLQQRNAWNNFYSLSFFHIPFLSFWSIVFHSLIFLSFFFFWKDYEVNVLFHQNNDVLHFELARKYCFPPVCPTKCKALSICFEVWQDYQIAGKACLSLNSATPHLQIHERQRALNSGCGVPEPAARVQSPAPPLK